MYNTCLHANMVATCVRAVFYIAQRSDRLLCPTMVCHASQLQIRFCFDLLMLRIATALVICWYLHGSMAFSIRQSPHRQFRKLPRIYYRSQTSESDDGEHPFYLLDGTAMLYRSYFSKTLLEGREEHKALLIMGMELARFIEQFTPRFIAIAFDSPDCRDNCFRRKRYPAYKAQRPPRPSLLDMQFPLAKRMVQALGLKALEANGYEADDIMATFAHWSQRRGLPCMLVSEDKDLYQMVNHRVSVMHPRSKEIMGPKEVEEKCGVPPDLCADYSALAGDQADNIPGLKGIGKKTATTLIQSFGDLEAIYENIDNIGSLPIRRINSVVENLKLQKEKAFLYRDLTTLVTDVEVEHFKGMTTSYFRYRGADAKAEEIMEELGFFGPLRAVQRAANFDYY